LKEQARNNGIVLNSDEEAEEFDEALDDLNNLKGETGTNKKDLEMGLLSAS
jgi:hypothetical protein